MNRTTIMTAILAGLLLTCGCRTSGVGAYSDTLSGAQHDSISDRLVALGETGAIESLPFIHHYLYDASDEGRHAARKALKRWRRANGLPTEQLPVDWQIELLSPDPDERGEVCDQIRKRGRAAAMAAVPYIAAALRQERDGSAIRKMLLALGASGTPEARQAIQAMLWSASEDTRDSAQKASALWDKTNAPKTNRGALAAGIIAGVLVGLAATQNGPSATPYPTIPQQSPPPSPQVTASATGTQRSATSAVDGQNSTSDKMESEYVPCLSLQSVCRGGDDADGRWNICQRMELQCVGGLRYKSADKSNDGK